MADYDVPEIPEDIKTPSLEPGTMGHVKLYPAVEKHMVPLGFPKARVENWEEAGVKKLGDLLEKYKSLQVFLDICVKCGACADKCHFYLGTKGST